VAGQRDADTTMNWRILDKDAVKVAERMELRRGTEGRFCWMEEGW
jgi:hypothetical protein